MNSEILYEFHPDSSDRLYLWLGIAIAIGAFFLTYYFLKQPKQGREHTKAALIAMLLFFTGLMATISEERLERLLKIERNCTTFWVII